MILYNVTINIEEASHDAWLEWMKREHLPMVMATGKFLRYGMYRIMSKQEGETGTTYSIQYTANTIEDYLSYQQNDAPALQEETRKKFEGKFVAFRTLLEMEHEYEKV